MTAQSAQSTNRPTTMLNFSGPALIIKGGSLAIFLAALIVYGRLEGNWLLFIVLLLTPDVSMLGYLLNPRIGSYTYNVVHTYLLPAILLAVSLTSGFTLGVQLAIIWFAHIGMDRTVGYGLKYPTAFKDTHLQRF